MSQTQRVQVLQPWLAWLDACADPLAAQPLAHGLWQRARRILLALAHSSEAAVAAWIAASERVLDADGRVRDVRPARALREMGNDRDAVLRLGVWGAVQAHSAAALPAGAAAFHALLAQVSRGTGLSPPGLLPSRQRGSGEGGFADSAQAALFFNGRLRHTLANLATLYDDHGADFARWLSLPDYAAGSADRQAWGQAWTVAVVATYLDWLHRASAGSVPAALALLWDDQPKRFRPPSRVLRPGANSPRGAPKPAVLPTGDDAMHVDLHLGAVLAQVLDHQDSRWQAVARGVRRFAVALSMKTLDQGDSQRRDPALAGVRNFTRYRGLSIVQLYMAVVASELGPAAQSGGEAA